MSTPEERAARLLRWYPRAWRDRYGTEFTELLISDIEERPRSAERGFDVARGGLVARLAAAGLAGCPLSASAGRPVTPQLRYRQASASLGSLACVLAIFTLASAAPWSELVIDRQAMSPSHRPAPTALLATSILSAAMLALLTLAALAALPVLATVTARLLRPSPAGYGASPGGGDRGASRGALLRPAAVLLGCALLLFFGGRHFGNGWPGTGGHGSFVPAGLAAFAWATSLSVSAYWAHPASFFSHFPPAEVYWMGDSPLVLAVAVIAAAVLIRRAGLSPRVLALEVRLAAAACAVMAVILGAAAWWVATSGGGIPAGEPFHPGLIDLACTVALALALPVAVRASRLARRELLLAGRAR